MNARRAGEDRRQRQGDASERSETHDRDTAQAECRADFGRKSSSTNRSGPPAITLFDHQRQSLDEENCTRLHSRCYAAGFMIQMPQRPSRRL